MGLGYDQAKAINPGIVYCSISGYSVLGPERGRPGYDLVIQGESGIMAMNGEEGQGPLKFGVAAVDMFTGMLAAQAILAVLLERTRTRHGRHVQMALYDCGLAITSYYGMAALLQGGDPPKFGNSHPSIVPYGVFEAADGPLVIAVGNNGQFRRFCEQVLQMPALAADPRFATNLERSRHRDALLSILYEHLAQWRRADLLARLHAADVPCGEVHGLNEALLSARSREAGLLHDYVDSVAGAQSIHAPAYVIDNARSSVRHDPPHLGEHTHAVLQELLGLDDAALNDLKSQHII